MIYKDMIKVNEPKSCMAEVYRVLRNNIEFAYNNSNVKSVLVTSTKNGEGKTTVAVNLAVTMANSGKKTLIIDCNLNNPSLHKAFEMPNKVGLTTMLRNEKYKGEAVTKTSYENLYLLTTGLNSERFSELLMGNKISDLLKSFKEKYDFIIVDTPAVIEKSDAQVISQYVDGCLLVIGSGEVNKEEARRTKDLLERVNAKILGAVLNKTEDVKKANNNIRVDESVIVTRREKVKERQEKFNLGSLKGGMNLKSKGIFARFFTMLMAVLMLLTMSSGMVSAKVDNLTKDIRIENQGFFYNNQKNQDIFIELVKNEKKINVRVKNNKKYANMDSLIQIWGSHGSEWVLVKDFGTDNVQKIMELDSNLQAKPIVQDYIYTWDLKAIDAKNEAYYNNPLQKNADEYKVYVKYKEKPNEIKYQEKFKTFYLSGDLNNQPNIITSFDMGNGMWTSWYDSNKAILANLNSNSISKLKFNPNILGFIKNPPDSIIKHSNYPVVANQKQPFLISMAEDIKSSDYVVSIEGDKGYTVTPLDISEKLERNLWLWVPEESGIFNIVMKSTDGKAISKRKVYVNSYNGEYLQLQDLKTWTEDEVTHLGVKIAAGRPTGFNTKENEALKFVIREPHVWSKTIKNYGEQVQQNEEGYYNINESREAFKFNQGNYHVSAAIKGKNSIEFEDAKGKTYKEAGLEGLKMSMTMKSSKGIANDGTYMPDTTFDFTITVEGVSEKHKANLEYAFLKWDARGHKLIQNYGDSNTYTWTPGDSGEYIIYGRVRQKTVETELPNSYEIEQSQKIKIYDQQVGKIVISSTKIDNHLIGSKAITNHQMHYIDITADYANDTSANKTSNKDNVNSRLMYKAYVVHDGIFMAINDYSPNNILPFYPKSSGEYKIIVLVKDSLSGSEEASKEYIITVN